MKRDEWLEPKQIDIPLLRNLSETWGFMVSRNRLERAIYKDVGDRPPAIKRITDAYHDEVADALIWHDPLGGYDCLIDFQKGAWRCTCPDDHVRDEVPFMCKHLLALLVAYAKGLVPSKAAEALPIPKKETPVDEEALTADEIRILNELVDEAFQHLDEARLRLAGEGQYFAARELASSMARLNKIQAKLKLHGPEAIRGVWMPAEENLESSQA